MYLTFTSHKRFDVLKLKDELKMAQITILTPQLSNHISEHPQQHLVIDFSEVTSIDNNIVRLLANIKKRLDANNKKLYFLNPGPEIAPLLLQVQTDEPLADIHTLERGMTADLHHLILPFTRQEKDMFRIQCNCDVCGSANVIGYLLDQNSYTWSWEFDDFFPTCKGTDGEQFDYFSALPIVCTDCCMTSTDISQFNIVNEKNAIMHHSTLSENGRFHLTKNIKKRKKLIESAGLMLPEKLFAYPRDRKNTYFLYLLAESSIRSLSLSKTDTHPFMVGYINYLAIRYARGAEKDELVDNCRTWLTQALVENTMFLHIERAQAYFILFSVALSLGKIKEVAEMYHAFSAMMETISISQAEASDINSPLFWYNQIQAMWQKEMSKKPVLLPKKP